jgi:hypothetical protein
MKTSGQFRSFTKQVQMDLLALNDTDLFHVVHQWVDGNASSNVSSDVLEDTSEETRTALGYTLIPASTRLFPHPLYDQAETESEGSVQWLAPSPHHLRALLTAMDIHVFTQHVITPAFQLLHTTYPEWDEGMTFNAHLANYLRQIKKRSATKEQSKSTEANSFR